MLMNQPHCRSSSSSSVAPNIEAVLPDQQLFYLKKSGNTSVSAPSTNNNPLGRFLNKLPKPTIIDGIGHTKRHSVVCDRDDEFRIDSKMVHKNSGMNNRKDSMSRSHSWIYGSAKQSGPKGTLFDDFGRSNGRDHVPSNYQYNSDICDCADSSSNNKFHPASSVRLKEKSDWRNYAFNDCPQHSPIGKQSSVNCDNNVSNGKKFVGSVRKLTWKSLKQVVKKRPSLDALKKQQNPPQSVHHPPPANAPDILFVPNYYFPPAKQNFYASCTDLYEEFPPSHPTASVRVRPKPNRQPWPCEFGPLPNYHEVEGEEESEEIYHSEWDLRQFMPYDVWLAENSPPPRSNNRVIPKVKSNSHTVDNTAIKKTTGSAGGQGHKNRLSILQSEVTAYELNRSDEDSSSSSFDCHSNSSEDLPNRPTEQILLPKVNGKTSQFHNRPAKQESCETARKSTSLTNVNTTSASTTKFCDTRSISKSSPKVPEESNRKTSNGATPAAVEKTSVTNKITSRVDASRVSHVSSSSSAPRPSGEQVKLVHKGSAALASKKKVEADVTKRRETTEINNENVRKNALKRNKSGPIESPALRNDLVQEDESEDDDDDDEPEQQQPIYAVKILVSQNNNSSNNSASSDYVKPILKKESVYEIPNVTQVKYSGQQSTGPSTTTTVILTDDVNRNKKIVQFDQNNPTVCGGLTDDGGTESDDTLVWDDPKELIDGLDSSTKRAISQVSISCSDEGKTSSSFNDNNAHHHNRSSSSSTGVNNLAGDENNHPQATEEKKKKEDIKMEVNKNETLRAFPGFKADRMAKTAEWKTVQVRPSTIQIMNPNSLLFHDTTRIRLNQSRPSVDQAFKLEGRSKSSHGRPAKVKQSSSFRQMGSTPLRPREPPPPPPARQTISKIPKQGEMKGSTEKRTSSASALRESVRRLNKNGNVTSSPSSKSSRKQSGKSAESVGRNNSNDACKKPTSEPTKIGDDDKNIEIVTKENSVSEIRIYSGTQNLQIDYNSQAAQLLKNYGEKQGADAITMSHNTAPSDTKSRPLSTSVILIIDDTTSMNPKVSAPTTYTKLQPLEVLQESTEVTENVSNVPQMECKVNKCADELTQNSLEKMEPLYDDVITRTAEAVDKLFTSFRESRSLSPPPLPSVPPPLPSVPPPSDSYGSSCSNVYNKIKELKSENSDTVYDDTMSILSSNYSTSGVKANYQEGNLPLYDDVLNLLAQDSDSGAESEGIPPPLPAQRPTLPLPKVSTDLPMLSFPLLLRQHENQLHTHTSSQLGDHTCSSSDLSSNRAKDTGSPVSEDIVERTRTLLSELSQKFNSLKFATPADYATYISKVIISSSSDSSSGVEEDYGSEKNYPSSNNSSNSPTTVQKESSPEPLLLARGRFLDSMKTAAAPSSLPHIAETNSCAEPVEEPIYEEIGEEDDGPIYSDAFATKSMFDGASRSEILTFLEAIRERLSTSVSDSASNSLSRSEKGAEIERNDSGIGSGSESGSLVAVNGNGGSKSAPSSSSHFICTDCNDTVDTTLAKVTATGSGSSPHYAPLGTAGDLPNQASSSASSSSSSNLCQTCVRKRRERKETLQEIYETEVKYGRDLRIIQEEFYNPIQIAGLLTKEQLEQIFLNVEQLCRVNTQLTGMLKSAIDDAVTTQDEDLSRVNVGKIFMEYGDTMMSAFEVYCTQQANAGALLTQLEKEKELLRIFLRVSQMENSVLRRMNLPAFLMVPVQRVTRYPLLMARLLKVTPLTHPSRAELFAAQVKIEQHLESMNKRTREASSIRLWRRISIMNGGSSPSNRPVGIADSDDTTTRIRKMSLDVLDWSSFTDVTCVAECSFDVVEFNGKPIRGVQACFLVRGKNLEILARKMERPVFFPPKEDLGIDAKLVLVRVKNSRFALLREPLCLSKCIVSQGENEYQDYVEINEITTKNTLFLRTGETDRTAEWLRVLQCHAACAGHWRRRRGALANIMMNGMIRHL